MTLTLILIALCWIFGWGEKIPAWWTRITAAAKRRAWRDE